MTEQNQALITQQPSNTFLAPAASIAQLRERYQIFAQFVASVLREGVDHQVIPGTNKPSLSKPGAEKLAALFGLSSRFICVERTEDWSGDSHNSEPFFYYLYRCELYRGDLFIASCEGSSNSHEKKYRYRWMNEMDIPPYVDRARLEFKDGSISEFAFAVDKAETSGKYGKPAAYWRQFQDAIAAGTAKKIQKKAKDKVYDAWEIGGKVYAVPNPDVADQVNTMQKMAQKRAFVGAVLIATNASDYFTQDIEDNLAGFGFQEGEFTEVPSNSNSNGDKAPAPAPTANGDGINYPKPNARIGKHEYPQTWGKILATFKGKTQAEIDGILQALSLPADLTPDQVIDKINAYLLGKAEPANQSGFFSDDIKPDKAEDIPF